MTVMANGRSVLGIAFCLLAGTAAFGREAASPSACQAAASHPAIATARAAVAAKPGDLRANVALADAWSDAGCFTDAVQSLQAAAALNPDDPQLATRLRVARSLVGEEQFFDKIDRADMAAKLKRNTFRCSSLGDVDACDEALRSAPNDPAVLAARADAMTRNRPAVVAAAISPASTSTSTAVPTRGSTPTLATAPAAASGNAVRRASAAASTVATAPAPAVAPTLAAVAPSGMPPARVARVADVPRVARAAAGEPTRRYTNEVADETQSH